MAPSLHKTVTGRIEKLPKGKKTASNQHIPQGEAGGGPNTNANQALRRRRRKPTDPMQRQEDEQAQKEEANKEAEEEEANQYMGSVLFFAVEK
jgi:hypothetical protein